MQGWVTTRKKKRLKFLSPRTKKKRIPSQKRRNSSANYVIRSIVMGTLSSPVLQALAGAVVRVQRPPMTRAAGPAARRSDHLLPSRLSDISFCSNYKKRLHKLHILEESYMMRLLTVSFLDKYWQLGEFSSQATSHPRLLQLLNFIHTYEVSYEVPCSICW